jgi:hypothetical protein
MKEHAIYLNSLKKCRNNLIKNTYCEEFFMYLILRPKLFKELFMYIKIIELRKKISANKIKKCYIDHYYKPGGTYYSKIISSIK